MAKNNESMNLNRSFTAGELAGNEELNRHGSLRYKHLQAVENVAEAIRKYKT